MCLADNESKMLFSKTNFLYMFEKFNSQKQEEAKIPNLLNVHKTLVIQSPDPEFISTAYRIKKSADGKYLFV